MEMTRRLERHLAGLEQDARQPRLTMVADGQAATTTRERTEGAATAAQAIYRNSYSANWVDSMCSTSFGDDCTGPPPLPCLRENALVDKGAAAPKSCLSSLDTLTNSRRWLTPRQRNFYGNEDHLLPPNSLVLPNRSDKFKNSDSIRLVRQQFHLEE